MKILCINSLDARYGSTYRIRALRDVLRNNGIDVRYLEWVQNAFYRLVRAKMAALFGEYDLLLTQKFNPITIAAMIQARLRGKPVLVDWDDFDDGLQDRFWKKCLATFCERIGPRLATRITTHSEKIRARAEPYCPTELIPQGFDARIFRPDPAQRAAHRKRWGFQEDAFVVGHLCTFTSGGTIDLDTILRSWTEPPLSHAAFFLVGGGPTEASIRRKVRDLGLEHRVTFSGLLPHEEVPRAVHAMDAGVVFMSDTEANLARVSFKVIEYLAMNVPVVGQVVGETAYRFGSLIRPATRETLAATTANVSPKEPRTDTARAIESYDWNIAAKGIVKTAQDVVHKSRTCN